MILYYASVSLYVYISEKCKREGQVAAHVARKQFYSIGVMHDYMSPSIGCEQVTNINPYVSHPITPRIHKDLCLAYIYILKMVL